MQAVQTLFRDENVCSLSLRRPFDERGPYACWRERMDSRVKGFVEDAQFRIWLGRVG